MISFWSAVGILLLLWMKFPVSSTYDESLIEELICAEEFGR
jgi:hypothetical protein